nr:drebrin-like protein B isoform X1 [Misgurnus anguillicaudatus]
MRAINLDTYSLSLLTAKEDILNPRASTNWALFAYDGLTNNLKLSDSGAGGLTELVGKFHSSRATYGLCRLGLTETGQPQIVMVCWVGEEVDEIRREECASHVPAIKTFFKEAQAFITASNQDEVTEEKIRSAIEKIRPPLERSRRPSKALDNEETVGTNYKKTNAAVEIKRINRDSFWARAEREEEERKEEERRRALENRRRWERERILQEKKEAEERDRKMEEKLQMIEEQRRIQAELDEKARKEEKARWEEQQREHEDDMRARLRRSESIEKAAEAAVLVSQRSMNPREFFRQLSASSQNSSSPVSPRSAKSPFRRYQRSLTDTAFIFERASSTSGPTSPHSPTLRSPFSRSPTASYKRPTSPLSPPYRTIPSPQQPHIPATSPPPTPPAQQSEPPVSPLPISRHSPAQSSPPSQTPVHESAFPASPKLLESHDMQIICVLSRQEVPSAPVPVSPILLEPEIDFIAKAVLVEEDEEDDVVVPEEPSAMSCAPSDTKILTNYKNVLTEVEEQESQDEPGSEEQPAAESEDPYEEQSEPEVPRTVTPTLVEVSEENSDDDLPENQEPCVKVAEYHQILEEDESECERPQNGTGGEDVDEDVEDAANSPPEKSCYSVNHEKDQDEPQTEVVTENRESSPERLLRVRALYDYQAEDDTELSFEPGDVISDVEPLDEAWWRGSSQDGRQGLFPANYVETI